jgi:CDP-glucose 4,6-dehydratase
MEMNEFWLDRRVFITGASGFIGGWVLKRLLKSRADVVCLVRDWVPQCELVRTSFVQKVQIVRGDLADLHLLDRILAEYEVKTVIHLAAQTVVTISNRNPISTFESNVRGTWNLLEACRRNPAVKQIVVASSDKAYGDQTSLPYDESIPLQGRHPYDVSKSCADLIAQAYAATYGLPVAISRCGNFYGGGDLNWNRIVPGTIRSVFRGRPPIIRSDGKMARDYFYVEDGAAAYMLLAERIAENRELYGQAFNFSNENQMNVLQLVERILSHMGSPLKPEIRNETSNEILNQSLNSAKAKRVLGWSPRFDLDEGLRRTIGWYKEFLGAF